MNYTALYTEEHFQRKKFLKRLIIYEVIQFEIKWDNHICVKNWQKLQTLILFCIGEGMDLFIVFHYSWIKFKLTEFLKSDVTIMLKF